MRHLRIYRAIQLIQRHGSIRQAAHMLSVSPSALNRSIQSFEEEMKLPLFDRVPGGMRLTTAGELLLDVIDRHLTEFDELQRSFGNLIDGKAGLLRLSIGSDIEAGLVMVCLAEFEAEFPGVSVEILQDDSVGSLHRKDVDLAILTNPATDDTVEVLYAHPVELAAMQHETICATPRRSGIWQLAENRVVLPPRGTGSHAAVSHVMRRNRLDPTATTILAAGQLPQQAAARQVTHVFPRPVFHGLPQLVPLPLELGTVQLSILRGAKVAMTRPAEKFLALLQSKIDAETG